MIAKIISRNDKYEYSFYRKNEEYEISFEFEEYYVGININKYGANPIAIKKTDCEIIK
jgi:hypothetical protein